MPILQSVSAAAGEGNDFYHGKLGKKEKRNVADNEGTRRRMKWKNQPGSMLDKCDCPSNQLLGI